MKKRRLRKIFIAEAYRTYGNLSRFFIRVFAGIMFLQFGIRQVANYDFFAQYFPSMFGMSSETTLLCMITIELVFSIFLIFGFLTRLSTIPPMISMIVAEYYIVAKDLTMASAMPTNEVSLMFSLQLGYVPMLFVGMFVFILLAGPGKVSVDYLLSLYFTNKSNLDELKGV